MFNWEYPPEYLCGEARKSKMITPLKVSSGFFKSLKLYFQIFSTGFSPNPRQMTVMTIVCV